MQSQRFVSLFIFTTAFYYYLGFVIPFASRRIACTTNAETRTFLYHFAANPFFLREELAEINLICAFLIIFLRGFVFLF